MSNALAAKPGFEVHGIDMSKDWGLRGKPQMGFASLTSKGTYTCLRLNAISAECAQCSVLLRRKSHCTQRK